MGGYLFAAGAITLGTVYLIFSYTELLRRPIEQITRADAGPAAGQRRASRASSDLLDTPAAPSRTGRGSAAAARARWRSSSTMSPSATTPTSRCCATCRSGWRRATVLGVLGRTGSGKTTLTRLLFRLYDPTAGAIRLGGVDLRDARLARSARGASAWSPRRSTCSTPRVRDNLTFFDRAIPDARIMAVLDDLGLGELVRAACRRGWIPSWRRRRRAVGGRGATAGLRPRLPERPRPGHPRRSVVAARPGHRAADRARGGPAAGRAHRHHHRPPAGDGAARRHDPDPGGRARGRVRAAAPRWRADPQLALRRSCCRRGPGGGAGR